MADRSYPELAFRCPRPPRFAADQRLAWCESCGKHVHNLSAISAREQEELIQAMPTACVSYNRPRSLWPAAAAALLLGSGMAMAQDQAAPEDAQDQAEFEAMVDAGLLIVPAQLLPLESVFLETGREEPTRPEAGPGEGR